MRRPHAIAVDYAHTLVAVVPLSRDPGPDTDGHLLGHRQPLPVAALSEPGPVSIGAGLREHRPRGLVEQIRRSGGARRWARELGVAGPQPAKWTDELIEAELRLLCAHTSIWPTKAEFADVRLGGLLTAVRRGHGSAVGRRLAAPAATRTPGRGSHHKSAWDNAKR